MVYKIHLMINKKYEYLMNILVIVHILVNTLKNLILFLNIPRNILRNEEYFDTFLNSGYIEYNNTNTIYRYHTIQAHYF